MGKFVDYYKLLGVNSNADEIEIKKAYRKMAKKYHPDLNHSDDIKRQNQLIIKFQQIKDAYNTLTNKAKRAKYDVEYKKYQQRLKFTNAYQEDRTTSTIGAIKDDEDMCMVWPKSKKQSSNEDIKQESQAVTSEFTPFDENYLRSISERRNLPKSKKSTTINTRSGIITVTRNFLKKLTIFNSNNNEYDYSFSIKKRIIAGTLATIIVGSAIIGIATRKSDDDSEVLASVTTVLEQDDKKNVVATFTTVPTDVEDNSVKETTPKETTQPQDDTIILYRIHKVVPGDTLSIYSKESNTTIEELKRVNQTERNTVVLGTNYIIPYFVEKEDLKFYTKVAQYDPTMTLEEFAKEYETNVSTIKNLNNEAIEKDYLVSTDTLVVPNFITKEEFDILKAAEQIKQKTK